MFWTFSILILAIKPLFGEMTKKEFLENYSIVIVFILTVGASITVPLARKWLDKRSFVSIGLKIDKKTIQDIVFGFFLSGLMAGLVFCLMIIFGFIEYHGLNIGDTQELHEQSSGFVQFMSVFSIGSLFILLLEMMFVGYWEELVFRGYLFQNMIAGMGMNLAVVISCLIYGLIHSMNPNAGLLSSSIIVLFGFLRIYGYLATKMLWLSIGMHIGWNFFQGPIFGYAASGHKKAALIDQTATSADWLSGGEFGPEGSIIIIPVIMFALFFMRWWSQRGLTIIGSAGE